MRTWRQLVLRWQLLKIVEHLILAFPEISLHPGKARKIVQDMYDILAARFEQRAAQ